MKRVAIIGEVALKSCGGTLYAYHTETLEPLWQASGVVGDIRITETSVFVGSSEARTLDLLTGEAEWTSWFDVRPFDFQPGPGARWISLTDQHSGLLGDGANSIPLPAVPEDCELDVVGFAGDMAVMGLRRQVLDEPSVMWFISPAGDITREIELDACWIESMDIVGETIYLRTDNSVLRIADEVITLQTMYKTKPDVVAAPDHSRYALLDGKAYIYPNSGPHSWHDCTVGFSNSDFLDGVAFDDKNRIWVGSGNEHIIRVDLGTLAAESTKAGGSVKANRRKAKVK